jgi:toxin-antitoxin system PIN domain toxin
MATLLDVNMLVALAWPNHVHHRPALAWFQRHHTSGWATCPLTESGFVRVSSNAAIVPEAKTPKDAMAVLRRIVALPHHEFWQDDVSFATSAALEAIPLVGHRQVTDAHLLTLALRHGGRLATLDGKIRGLIPRGYDASAVLSLVLEESPRPEGAQA